MLRLRHFSGSCSVSGWKPIGTKQMDRSRSPSILTAFDWRTRTRPAAPRIGLAERSEAPRPASRDPAVTLYYNEHLFRMNTSPAFNVFPVASRTKFGGFNEADRYECYSCFKERQRTARKAPRKRQPPALYMARNLLSEEDKAVLAEDQILSQSAVFPQDVRRGFFLEESYSPPP